MLDGLPTIEHPDLLVGTGTFDDAGVFRLSKEIALVQSVDFFTPVVDDPFDFGRIAAANALSDIYAMGARPLTALAVCTFPVGTLPLEALHRTLAGGLAVLQAEGVVLLGGHSIKGPEFSYGLAVTGVVHPDRILTNSGARPGDLLVLTKPLGTGVLSTQLKRGALSAEAMGTLIDVMASTNRVASEAAQAVEVHALTDVTGYGLLGHGIELAEAGGVALEIDGNAIGVLPGAREAVRAGAIPGGLTANREFVAARVTFDVDDETAALLCDPQTSGGLLAAVAPEGVRRFVEMCRMAGVDAVAIGRVITHAAGTAVVRVGSSRRSR